MAESTTPQFIRTRRMGEVSVITFESPYLQAEDDIAKAGAELNEAVGKLPGSAKIVLTFHGVRFVSSSMLAQVVKLHNKVTKGGGKLRICGLAPAVREVVHASHLDRLLDVHDDEAAALAKF